MWYEKKTTLEEGGSEAEGRYGKVTPSMRTEIRRKDACTCPMVARRVIKASIEECDESLLTEQYHEEKGRSKEKWTGDAARQGNDESNNH